MVLAGSPFYRSFLDKLLLYRCIFRVQSCLIGPSFLYRFGWRMCYWHSLHQIACPIESVVYVLHHLDTYKHVVGWIIWVV